MKLMNKEQKSLWLGIGVVIAVVAVVAIIGIFGTLMLGSFESIDVSRMP